MTFESTFKALKSGKFAFHLLQIANLTGELLSFAFYLRLATVFEFFTSYYYSIPL